MGGGGGGHVQVDRKNSRYLPFPSPWNFMQPSFFVWASLPLGWFSNRMGKSVDDGTCKLKNWLDQLQGNKLGSGSHIQSFPCAFSWSTDVPILLLNQPNILFRVAAKLTWSEVLRAVFTGTVNKTKILSFNDPAQGFYALVLCSEISIDNELLVSYLLSDK